MKTQTHTGMDFFFSGMSNKEARLFVEAINNMKRTMNGHPLKFKINRKHPRYLKHQEGTTVFTTRYPDVPCTAADLWFGLDANRKWCSAFLQAIRGRFPKSKAVYEGSEFYLNDCDLDVLSTEMDTLAKKLEETV